MKLLRSGQNKGILKENCNFLEVMAVAMGNDLTRGHVGKVLLKFAAPFMLANLLQTLYNLVDAVVVGHFVGADGLSAVSGGGELITLYTFIAIGFGGAGQTLIGQYAGAKDREGINRTIGTEFTLLMVLSVGVLAILLTTGRIQLGWLNVPPEAFEGSVDYLMVCAAGMPFIFGYNMVSAVLRGMGDSKRPLLFVAVASVLNLVLDLLFVAVFGLGPLGAGLATVMGQAVSFLWALVYLYRRREAFGFDFAPHWFKPRKKTLGTLVRLGIPMTAQGAMVCISMLYVSAQINLFGVAASAANSIHMKLNNVLRIVSQSMVTAGGGMVAQSIGAGKRDRVRFVFRWVFIYTMSYCTLCALAIFFFPTQIFGLFNTEPQVLAYGRIYALCGVIEYLAYGLRAPGNSVVQGTGAAALGFTACLIDGVIARIGLSFLFGHVLGMGVAGFWLGGALAGHTNYFFSAPYYFSGAWKRKKSLVE